MGFGAGKGKGRGGDTCGCSTPVFLVSCGGFVVVLIVAIVLLAVSVKSLDANEVGLAVDGFSQNINNKLYTGGTYFLGPVYSFVKYPTTLQTITFSSTTTSTSGSSDGPSLSARTADGLLISVGFSFNYQLRTTYEDINGLYLRYGDAAAVDTLYARIARNVVRTVVANYPASQLFISQETVRAAILAQLTTEVGDQSATVTSFNILGSIGVPTALSAAIARQQSAQQDKTKAEQDLQTTRINADARINANATAATLIVTGATNVAAQLRQSVNAQIASLAARYNAERASYLALKSALNLTTPQLLQYVWLDAQAEGAAKNATTSLVRLPAPPALGYA